MKRPLTTYRLSNRQCKELLTRRTRLVIAIPVPPEALDDNLDPMVIVEACLPIHAEYCQNAWYHSVSVVQHGQTDGPSETGSQAIFGQIARSRREIKTWPTVLVECVLAELHPPTKQEHLGTAPMRWPGRIFHAEKEITPAEAETDSSEGHAIHVRGGDAGDPYP